MIDWDSDGCVTGAWLFPHGWCRLLTCFDVARFCLFCCARRCPPRRSSWPQQALSTRLFALQLAPPSHVDGTSSRDNFRVGQSDSYLPSSGLLCSNASTSRPHFRGSAPARSLICSGVSGINKDLLKVRLTHCILYDLTLTLFTYILGVQVKEKARKAEIMVRTSNRFHSRLSNRRQRPHRMGAARAEG